MKDYQRKDEDQSQYHIQLPGARIAQRKAEGAMASFMGPSGYWLIRRSVFVFAEKFMCILVVDALI